MPRTSDPPSPTGRSKPRRHTPLVHPAHGGRDAWAPATDTTRTSPCRVSTSQVSSIVKIVSGKLGGTDLPDWPGLAEPLESDATEEEDLDARPINAKTRRRRVASRQIRVNRRMAGLSTSRTSLTRAAWPYKNSSAQVLLF